MIPNRLILYREPSISKHLHYIKVYSQVSIYKQWRRKSQFHSVIISEFWGMRPHGHQHLFPSKQNSLHVETLEILVHPLFTTSVLNKGQKGKRRHQNELSDMGTAKLSSPGSLSTPERAAELEMGKGSGEAAELLEKLLPSDCEC